MKKGRTFNTRAAQERAEKSARPRPPPPRRTAFGFGPNCFVLLATLFCVLIFVPQARAAEPQPGDTCSNVNRFTVSGGPELSGNVYFMTCQGGVWSLIYATDTSGNVGIGTTTPLAVLDTRVGATSGGVHIGFDEYPSGWGRIGAFNDGRSSYQPMYFDASVYSFGTTGGGNVGIGDSTPASLLTVGNGGLFQVNSSGDLVKIKNVTYSWPSSQGSASTVLTNDGSGNLSWTAGGGSQPYVIGGTLTGNLAGSQVLLEHPFPIAVTIPAGCTNSRFEFATAATAGTTISLQKCTGAGFTSCTQFGTAVISAGQKVASFTCATATSFAAGTDSLLLTGPSTPDATAATPGWAIYGTR